MKLLKYKLFVEARLSDITKFTGTGITFSNEIEDSTFLKFKTLSKRIDKKKIRLVLDWNHTLQHDLVQRLKDRTGLKNILELNDLISNGFEELYTHNHEYIKENGEYSLWFSEYNFSLIVELDKYNIFIKTILPGMVTYKVKNIIELKSTI